MPGRRASKPTPTIKGLFVNSHVNMLRQERGEAAVRELEQRAGCTVVFKNLEDVPVRTEVCIIEHVLDILRPGLVGAERAREAGRLHFRNFCTTRLGTVLLSSLPHTTSSFKTLLINAGSIGRSVFKHTDLACRESNGTIVVEMNNTDYPLEHFEGFFDEWAHTYGLPRDSVTAVQKGATQCYTIKNI